MLVTLKYLALTGSLLGLSLAEYIISDTSSSPASRSDMLDVADPLVLLQGIPQACIDNPVVNEHICQAWIDAIIANNLQENMTAIWKINRPSIFPSEEELAADQAWLDGHALLEANEHSEYAGVDEDDNEDVGLEKRKKKPKSTTTKKDKNGKPAKTPAPEKKKEHCICCDNERGIGKHSGMFGYGKSLTV